MKLKNLSLILLSLVSFSSTADSFSFKEREVVIETNDLSNEQIELLSAKPSQNLKNLEEYQKKMIAEIVENTLMSVLFDKEDGEHTNETLIDFQGSVVVGSVEDKVLVRLMNNHTELVSVDFYKKEMSQFNKNRNEVIETLKEEINENNTTGRVTTNLRTQ